MSWGSSIVIEGAGLAKGKHMMMGSHGHACMRACQGQGGERASPLRPKAWQRKWCRSGRRPGKRRHEGNGQGRGGSHGAWLVAPRRSRA